MKATDFIKDYDKITSDDKHATYYHANTMFKFAEDYHKEKLKELTLNGYYCPRCKKNMNGIEVTFEEYCDYCGTKLML